jgi:hypothetical protein
VPWKDAPPINDQSYKVVPCSVAVLYAPVCASREANNAAARRSYLMNAAMDSSSFLLAHCVIPIAARSAALVSHYHNRVRTPPTISPDKCRFGNRYFIPAIRGAHPSSGGLTGQQRFHKPGCCVCGARRPLSATPTSSGLLAFMGCFRIPARLIWQPSRCLLPVAECISPSNSGGPHCTPRAVRMHDDSSGTGGRRGAPLSPGVLRCLKGRGAWLPGSRLRKPYWKRC